jgi:hypothetical protein
MTETERFPHGGEQRATTQHQRIIGALRRDRGPRQCLVRCQGRADLRLIGSNGAGKTMLLNCLSRLYQAGTGTIHFAGERLLQLPHHCVARLGIGRTFQSLAPVSNHVGARQCRGWPLPLPRRVCCQRVAPADRRSRGTVAERARQGSARDARTDGNRGCAVERKAGRCKKLPKR